MTEKYVDITQWDEVANAPLVYEVPDLLSEAIAILERVRDRLLVTGDKRIKDREIVEFLEKIKCRERN